MKNATISATGELQVLASQGSAAPDFDFLMGAHHVRHRKLKSRLTDCNEWIEFDGTHTLEPLLNGNGNLEKHFMQGVEGIALRLFDPATRLWSIYWADSKGHRLDPPVIGSFENKTGYFYGKDVFEGKPVLLQFKWEATNENAPVWSQAFSDDNGETWEWNWYMYFTKPDTIHKDEVSILELRNYIIKEGARDRFIDFFEENLFQPQIDANASMPGQYRVKGEEDHFCWLRAFGNMKERSVFLNSFYYGALWKQHRSTANSMLANNDNVHLLRPMMLSGDSIVAAPGIKRSQLLPKRGIAVVEFYTANQKLPVLLQLFAKNYLPLLKEAGIKDYSLWTSVTQENDFPQLPVFQDKNLLVTISFYQDELAFTEAMKKVRSKMNDELKYAWRDAITLQHTMILYPTEKTKTLK